ncbi:TetR/AcrR family transcriptional regulator [Actinomadura macrotermitis]|uniref:HTH-type transcriptional regulator BetI n=1 Tax=Actinomadura macrotermitis TaxID=2585200 RepID=A0A7K0C7G1_9ACTN|nr:TetR/AcrR family transcriptional regulator [Actinomadura macrotermitis]MQY09276.1 HTH-type transcriptional regulator BetI [Actinomadura macrotermitis]
MAKVDSGQRRREVAEAVWRVVRRGGLEQASVRNVAEEAGLSMGSLRHYFATQADLLSFTMRAVIERVGQRIAALPDEPDPRRRAERVLAELLPLDAERAAENEVWLAFTARAQVDAGLRAVRDEGYAALRAGCRALVEGLAGVADVETETDRLHALLDGLAVHMAVRPDLATADRARAVIARHLDDLEA